MRSFVSILVLTCVLAPAMAVAQESNDGPSNEKAHKTYENGLKQLAEHRSDEALIRFKRADQQDGGHCVVCQKQMIKYGVQYRDWKAAEVAAEELVGEAKNDKEKALAHYQFAEVLLEEGLQKRKEELFARSHDEIGKALEAYRNFPAALYLDGRALANLRQDEGARARFEEYVKTGVGNDYDRKRAGRYIEHPELARARLVPPFTVTTSDGQLFSMDDLQGKVVLLDFWATWCPPCRAAVPHLREISKKFQGQPLVILSVSLDGDEQKWKAFIAIHEMTWPQYREAGIDGVLARMFEVTAIPRTFIIDADGVLREEHLGDALIEDELQKLVAQARELQSAGTPGRWSGDGNGIVAVQRLGRASSSR
ncbi:MAG TPA: redoxin domain-containing protein [Candidatus Eisenbacteria bacterium]|nr:redoxin domain-containing protein [Candidatus Eisenbacteria bacterium]